MDQFNTIAYEEDLRGDLKSAIGSLDKEWFDAHPHYQERVRRYVAGEFDTEDAGLIVNEGDLVVVRVLRSGVTIPLFVGSFTPSEWDQGGIE